jgi:heat shock protein HtpX
MSRALIAILLSIGFYIMLIGLAGSFMVLSYVLYHWDGLEGRHKLAGFACGLGVGVLIMAAPPILRRPSGVRLNECDHPELFALLADISERAGQAMPAEVFLTMETNAWVAPLGGIMGIGSKWVLGIGLSFMHSLTVAELKGVLAHEFGHFLQGDTKVSPWISKTRASIILTESMLGVFGSRLALPFTAYSRMFLRITCQIGRAQELKADRFAASVAGPAAFIEALRTLSRISKVGTEYFDRDVFMAGRTGFIPPVLEGFSAKVSHPSVVASMDEALKKDLAKSEPETGDTHPPLSRRITAVADVMPPEENQDTRRAIVLLKDVCSLEHELLLSELKLKNQVLRPIKWTDVGTAVWMPEWKEAVQRRGARLKGGTLADLFDIAAAAGVHSIETFTLGAAFACSLRRAGWTVESGHALPLFRKGELEFNPFDAVERIASGDFTQETWRARIESLGLDQSIGLAAD